MRSEASCHAAESSALPVLQVGNLPTLGQNRAHFGAWCVISAPLYLGFDLRNRSLVDAMMPVIGNAEAVAVNQQYAVSCPTPQTQELDLAA